MTAKAKGKNRAVRTPRRKTTDAGKTPVATVAEVMPAPEPVPYDETLLECARTQWQFGDWQRLAQLDQATLQHHPQRPKLALLAAAAHFQLGETNQAHRYLRLAQDWGCSRKLIAQMLISGAHNSLACANLLVGRDGKAAEHFHDAVRLGGVLGDPVLLAQARTASQKGWLKIGESQE